MGTESIAPHRSWADRVVSFRTSQASLCCRPCPTRRGRPACPLAPSSPSIVAGPSSCGRCRASASPQRTPISGGQNLSTLGSCTPWSDPPRDWRTVTGGSRRVAVPSELFLRLLAGRTSVKETPLLRRRIGMKCTFQGRGRVGGLRGRDLRVRSHLRPVPGTVSHAVNPPGDSYACAFIARPFPSLLDVSRSFAGRMRDERWPGIAHERCHRRRRPVPR